MKRILSVALLLFAPVLHAVPAHAQWQAALPGQEGEAAPTDPAALAEAGRKEADRGNHEAALAYYVRAIARQPNDANVLRAAGEEALAIGDTDAAFGFLGRAATLDPRDPGARAGYGRALALSGRPKDALTLFDQAVRLGMPEVQIAGDRGLARDLLGENRRAQRDYRLALASDPADPLLLQRLALSLAISGDREGAIALLQPLIRAGNASDNAYRTLAFVHALTGDVASARKLAMARMSAAQADAFTPFFARISLLKDEEKAAAVHLGRLPQVRLTRPDRVVPGRVTVPDKDPMAARSAAVGDVTPVLVRDEPQKKPAAEAPVTKAAKATEKSAPEKKAAEKAVKVEKPSLTAECADLAGKRKARCEVEARALEKRCGAGKRTAECVDYGKRLTALEDKAAKPAGKAAQTAGKGSGKEKEKDRAETPVDPCDGLSGQKRAQCQADARALERRCAGANAQKTAECQAYAKRKDEAETPPKPGKTKAKAAERYWVQVASGRNKGDLPKEWARLKAKSAVLARQTPYVGRAPASNRLVVGPFDTPAAARDFVNRLSAAGLSSFSWTSAAGEDVDRLQ